MRAPKRTSSASQYLRGAMVVLALVLPTFSLAVLGTVWLWQNNSLLIWAIAASATALMIYGLEYWLVRSQERPKNEERPEQKERAADKMDGARAAPTGAERTPREQAAWQAVEALADGVRPETLDSRDAVLALAARTVEAVSRHMHPGEKDPLWKFTVPEALVLVQRVSGELNRFVVNSVPLGDRLTVGQLLAIYRWRGVAGMAEKAYDLYRLLRFVNPATAIAGELRERVSGQLMDGMRTELTRRVARAYVREVGEAAIDLYSGRLNPDLVAANPMTAKSDTESGADDAHPSQASGQTSGPLEILIVGQAGVGKSSLINALTNEVQAATDVVPTSDEFTVHAVTRDDVPLTLLIDSPSLDLTEQRVAELIERAESADAIVWLVSAIRPDRAADVEALQALRAAFAARLDRRPPPIVFLLTHIDRVRPFNEWHPPYDLTDTATPKSRSIAEASSAVASDLDLDDADVIPVALAPDKDAYNVDVVWSRLVDMFDDARNVRLIRQLSEGRRRPITKTLWRQAVGAGRLISKIART